MEKKKISHLQNETIGNRILIVDDDKDFVLSLVDILEPLGYTVETAYNTKDACKKIQNFDVHLALIDVRLGNTNGVSLISEFKSANPDILCVMVTAYTDIDAPILALKEGAYDYLRKPIETHDLLTTIDRCFETIHMEAEKNVAVRRLRESEEKYRSLFETAGDAIIIAKTTEEGNVIFADCNENTLEIFGCSREEIIGKSPEDLSPSVQPDGRPSHEVIFETVNAALDDKPQFVEFTHRKLDGTLFDTEVKLNRINIGKETYLQAIVRDVTERKRAENALRRSEKNLSLTYDTVGDVLFQIGVEHNDCFRFLSINQAGLNATGLTEKQIVGKRIEEVIPESSHALVLEKYKEAIRENKTVKWEEASTYPAGKKIGEVTITPALNEDGGCTHLIGSVHDITERKQAEEALRESETKFRRLSQEFHTLLNAIDDPMIQVSPELKILWANRSAATFSEKDISSLQGRYCYKLWFNRSAPCDDCPAITKCFQTGEAGSIQFSTPDGRFCNLKAFPVKDEKGKVHNVIEIYSDITKEMIMQEESTRAAQMATLGELAASVAHEINNPVYGITMCAQSLLAEAGNGKIRDYDIVKMILKESGRIANVTKCLLSSVRDSEDIKSLCDIYGILSDTLTITGVIIQKEGINLRIQVPKDLPLILAHPQLIQQVFLNILSNARYTLNKKYPDTDENKIIEITGREIMIDDCPYNQIIFYDRGMGISADKIHKVLNPFFTTKPVGKGTGLGLSISNKIIRDHDGKIEIDSTESEFTKIIITLPVAR